MKHFEASTVVRHLDTISSLDNSLRVLKRVEGGGSKLPENLQEVVIDLIDSSVSLCVRNRFTDARDYAMQLQGRLDDMDVSTLKVHINHLYATIFRDLQERRFLQISPDLTKYVEDAPGGTHILNNLWPAFRAECAIAFPSAAHDIQEAGNCLAVECNTASVFHLMRVAEYGMRTLAWDRRVKIPKGPIEFATWEEIIRELEKAEAAIMQYPKGAVREAQLNFYHGAMMELRAFKNAFRNQVMHTRSVYSNKDAIAIYEHVEHFMFILAGHISENKRNSIIWKKL